jgi:ATP-dependent DNA helicase RecG
LPDPEFREEFGGFSVTFFKDRLTEDILKKLGTNERQRGVISYLKENHSISNSQYQKLFSVSKGTATKELGDLVNKEVLVRAGIVGAGTSYTLIGSSKM